MSVIYFVLIILLAFYISGVVINTVLSYVAYCMKLDRNKYRLIKNILFSWYGISYLLTLILDTEDIINEDEYLGDNFPYYDDEYIL